MAVLLALSRAIDAVNAWIGRTASWLILVAVLVSAGNAIVRKLFNASSNGWLELQWYLFGAVFMLCAAWTLMLNEHIRIDVVVSHMRKPVRDWIDLVGHAVLLIPLLTLLVYETWPFFLRSLRSGEVSSNPGGLIVWPAKGIILLGFILLLAQAVSELIKRIAVIAGLIPEPYRNRGGPH
jgi:TRAP-type mannitol/chloroaromatic compound transport system permease small subunit